MIFTKCPQCGGNIAPGSVRCSHCGYSEIPSAAKNSSAALSKCPYYDDDCQSYGSKQDKDIVDLLMQVYSQGGDGK